MLDEIAVISTDEFDAVINDKLKSSINNYYRRIYTESNKRISDFTSDLISIKVSKSNLLDIFYHHDGNNSDNLLITNYLDAVKTLEGNSSHAAAENLVADHLRQRLFKYLNESNQPWSITNVVDHPEFASDSERHKNIQLSINFSMNDLTLD